MRYAALDMQAAIRRCAEQVWRAPGIKAEIRVREMDMTYWLEQADAELRQCTGSATGRDGA